jgi:hypothetical protein
MTKQLLAVFACALVLYAQAQDILTNDVIIKMVQAGVPTGTIIRTIQSADKVDFRFLPSDLDAFSQAKVPEDVFKAMVTRDKTGAPALAATPVKPAPTLLSCLESA